MARQKDDERDSGSAINRVLDLMEAIARTGRALTVPELCGILDLPKPTAHRLCQRLENEGYLAREPGGRHYAVGPRLMRLSIDVLRWGAGAERRSILKGIVDEIGETCNFTALAGDEVVYVDRVEARWPLRLHLEPGSRVPLHCTASGKLFLASMPPARRERTLSAMNLSPFTAHTITDRAKLEDELAVIASQGYSLDREEFLLGLVAIAVPVKDRSGATIAALACHAPGARFDLGKAVERLPLFLEAATRLAATLPD
ncbi:IclR family transcriptional regulator [Mesorhizobium sp. SP-1A]|uniref:IclR family transcriptional regulator n=1 Tax=Mesorhizobium sp. SP-1A TaxID=3077840 RepID=UPI0028F71F28|nr:IclR family transcriptional regulator [Mesorhizobium sp. SP-1A]